MEGTTDRFGLFKVCLLPVWSFDKALSCPYADYLHVEQEVLTNE